MSAPQGYSHFWEGELAIPGLQRRRICRMDGAFLDALHRHHPELAPGYRMKPRDIVAAPVVVEATPEPIVPPEPSSLHLMDEDFDEAELVQIKSILRRGSVNAMVRQVSEATNISPYRIVSLSRNKHVVAARNWVFFLLQEDGFSLSQIGRMFFKDHTTILHGINRHVARKAQAE